MTPSAESLRSVASGGTALPDGDRPPVVTVDSVAADGCRVESTVSYDDDLRPFFDESPFYVEYCVDVSDLPESILTIPVLAHVCPVAWAVGADVRVPVADRRFLDALESVGNTLCEMYPFVEGGRVVAERAPEWDGTAAVRERASPSGDSGSAGGAGVLFTGGVDSLATYVRHREEEPTLITVQGWVIGVDEAGKWAHTVDRIEGYADRFGVDARFVRSNMLEFLDTAMLDARYRHRHDGSWYSAVGSGLGMTGLCAPLAVAEGMRDLYVAATTWPGVPVPSMLSHWDGRAMPWGSHPDIDDEIAWAGTEVHHDAFERTRQERIGAVADHVRERDPDLPVRSCAKSTTSGNCGRCEKCVRTSLGLMIAGLDPRDHGFPVDRAAFERARRQFETDGWTLDENLLAEWADIRAALPADPSFPVEGSESFAEWVRDADVAGFVARSEPPARDRLLRGAARVAPYPVYARLSTVYDTVRRLANGR
ncbi:hypothetical protein [Halosimplex halobium]|uniref:hypothetical protein n=1 Tax=Halosimplex halobium TaxID=3396618 RepID=UPI003F547340